MTQTSNNDPNTSSHRCFWPRLSSTIFSQLVVVYVLVHAPVVNATRPNLADVQSSQNGKQMFHTSSSFGISGISGGGTGGNDETDPAQGFFDSGPTSLPTEFWTYEPTTSSWPTKGPIDTKRPTHRPTPSITHAPTPKPTKRPTVAPVLAVRSEGPKTTAAPTFVKANDREEAIVGANSSSSNVISTPNTSNGETRPSFVRPVNVNLHETANISTSGSPIHTDTIEDTNTTTDTYFNNTNTTDELMNYTEEVAGFNGTFPSTLDPSEANTVELFEVNAHDTESTTAAAETMTPSPSPTTIAAALAAGFSWSTESPTWSYVAAAEANTNSTNTSVLDNLPSYGSSSPAPAPTSEMTPTLQERPDPTEAPTFPIEQVAVGTSSPTTIDENANTVEGRTSLLLYGLVGKIPQDTDTEMVFTMAVYEFISSATAEAPVYLEVAEVKIAHQGMVTIPNPLRRRRRELLYLRTLEQQMRDDFQALQVDLLVIGTPKDHPDDNGFASDAPPTSELIEQELYNLFHEYGRDFLSSLKEASWAQGDDFFTDLVAVEAKQLDATAAPTKPPATLDTTGSAVAFGSNAGDGQSTEGGIPLILVIGAAVACGVLLLLLIGVACYVRKTRSKGRHTKVPSAADEVGATSLSSDEQIPPAQRMASVSKSNKTKLARSNNKDPSPPQADLPASLRFSDQDSDTGSSLYTANNNPANSYGFGRNSSGPDIEDDYGGAGDFSVMDNSYAYSLEPGIEPSVAGVPSQILPSGSQSVGASYSLISAPGGPSGSNTSGTSSFAFLRQNGPTNPNLIKREVIAPSGKLGIVIDTTLDGPVVHKVNPGSALEGKIWSGDIIVAIDDVDTRAMSATSITALMVKTANQRRKLTILSDSRKK